MGELLLQDKSTKVDEDEARVAGAGEEARIPNLLLVRIGADAVCGTWISFNAGEMARRFLAAERGTPFLSVLGA